MKEKKKKRSFRIPICSKKEQVQKPNYSLKEKEEKNLIQKHIFSPPPFKEEEKKIKAENLPIPSADPLRRKKERKKE